MKRRSVPKGPGEKTSGIGANQMPEASRSSSIKKRRKKPENEISQALQQWRKPQQKSDSPGRKAQEGRRHWLNRKKEPPSKAQAENGRYRKVAGEDADRF